MTTDLDVLFNNYCDYVRLLNDRLAPLRLSKRNRARLVLKLMSFEEFSGWWREIAQNPVLKQRWLDQLQSPNEAREKTAATIRSCLLSLRTSSRAA